MPNLILKSNIANKTFNVQHKVLRMPVQPGVVELVITPVSRYNIDAKDFSFGLLPKEVSNVEYQNLGDKVIARVSIKSTIDSKQPVNVFIPISGRSFVKKDSFSVTETTIADNKVFISELSTNNKSVDGNKTTYNVNNELGKKSLLFSKKFLVFGDDYFSTEPSYVIKNNSTRYTVTSSLTTNNKNQITGKNFEFFYTSPSVVTKSIDTEISFKAEASQKSRSIKSVIATKKEEEKIYSVDYGRRIGKEGGLKKITVRGVPGTTFQFLISNESNQTYSATTGAFEDGGGVINGVVPALRDDNYYGEWRFMLRIPRTTTTQNITIQLVDGAAVNHADITSVATAAIATNASGGGSPVVLQTSRTVLTIGVDRTDTTINQSFLGEIVVLEGGSESEGDILLGEGNTQALVFEGEAGDGLGGRDFSFAVYGFQDKFIKIERQPRFELPVGEDNFVAWDSGGEKPEGVTSDGQDIISDWDFDVVPDGEEPTLSVESGINVQFEVIANGIGKPDGAGAFPGVIIRGHVEPNNISKFSSTINIRLHNFLSQVDRS